MRYLFTFKGLLKLDFKKFYCEIGWDEYRKIRPKIEKRLMKYYGVVYPRVPNNLYKSEM